MESVSCVSDDRVSFFVCLRFFSCLHTASSFRCSTVCTHLFSCLSNFLYAVDGEGLQTKPCSMLLRAFELQRCSCVAIRQQASLCIQIEHWVSLFVFLFKRYTRFKRLHVGIDDELSLSQQVRSLFCHVKISGDSQSFCLSYVFFCSTLTVFFSFIRVSLPHINGACIPFVLRKFCYSSSFEFAP